MHVRMADQAVCIGPPPGADSYLNVPAILSAIEITDADAVHPGYGFLAENAAFAEICANYGVRFIGPSSEAIRLMGDKIEARRAVQKVKCPSCRGATGRSPKRKRASGRQGDRFPRDRQSGGRGRRQGDENRPQPGVLHQRVPYGPVGGAVGLRGSDVYIEKYFDIARHIEVQVMGTATET